MQRGLRGPCSGQASGSVLALQCLDNTSLVHSLMLRMHVHSHRCINKDMDTCGSHDTLPQHLRLSSDTSPVVGGQPEVGGGGARRSSGAIAPVIIRNHTPLPRGAEAVTRQPAGQGKRTRATRRSSSIHLTPATTHSASTAAAP